MGRHTRAPEDVRGGLKAVGFFHDVEEIDGISVPVNIDTGEKPLLHSSSGRIVSSALVREAVRLSSAVPV